MQVLRTLTALLFCTICLPVMATDFSGTWSGHITDSIVGVVPNMETTVTGQIESLTIDGDNATGDLTLPVIPFLKPASIHLVGSIDSDTGIFSLTSSDKFMKCHIDGILKLKGDEQTRILGAGKCSPSIKLLSNPVFDLISGTINKTEN